MKQISVYTFDELSDMVQLNYIRKHRMEIAKDSKLLEFAECNFRASMLYMLKNLGFEYIDIYFFIV